MMDCSTWEEQFPCYIGKNSIWLYTNAAFSRVVVRLSEGRAKVSKVNEITAVDGDAEVIHLASWS